MSIEYSGIKCKLKVWEEKNTVQGQAMFPFKEWETVVNKFSDLLIGNINNSENLEFLKDEGYPTKKDSNYLLLAKDKFGEADALLRKFRVEYPGIVTHPGLLHFLFRTKKYKQWKELAIKREREEKQTWEILDNLLLFGVSTNHDYPEVCIRSKIYNKEELLKVLQKVAAELKIELALSN